MKKLLILLLLVPSLSWGDEFLQCKDKNSDFIDEYKLLEDKTRLIPLSWSDDDDPFFSNGKLKGYDFVSENEMFIVFAFESLDYEGNYENMTPLVKIIFNKFTLGMEFIRQETGITPFTVIESQCKLLEKKIF